MPLRRILAGVACAVAAVVFMTTAVRAFVYDPSPEIAPPPGVTLPDVPATDYPVHISIPSASIDADIEKVGLTTGNHMATSAQFSNAGWYKYGPVPGQVGTAVIEGHLDNGLGLDGAFKHLGDVSIGDVVTVTAQDGRTIRFAVNATSSYPYQSVPSDVLFGTTVHDGKAHLNLVTCTGTWTYDQTEGMTYTRRLVVFATEI
jgi:sortase (surface protein transpeptidase)